MALLAYHNDPAIKAKYIARVKAHRAADEIVRGSYWDGHRGCAVGCTIHGDDHSRYETKLGIPVVLAHLQDRIFENLPTQEALDFPLQFLEVIEVGADLSLVWSHFAVWLLADAKDGVLQYAQDERGQQGIEAVVALHQRVLSGYKPTHAEWCNVAAVAAYAADAGYAAAVAAYAAVGYVAAVAVYAADAAVAAGRREHYSKQRKALLALLKAAPIVDATT